MAITQTTPPASLAAELVTVTGVLATSNNNVTGSTSGNIYLIEVDNTVNPTQDIYLKIVDAASATEGVTQHQIRLRVFGGEKTTFLMLSGHAYSSGLCLWVTTGASHTDVVSPTTAVDIKLLVTA